MPHEAVSWESEARIALSGNAWETDPQPQSANDVVDAKAARAIVAGGPTLVP